MQAWLGPLERKPHCNLYPPGSAVRPTLPAEYSRRKGGFQLTYPLHCFNCTFPLLHPS